MGPAPICYCFLPMEMQIGPRIPNAETVEKKTSFAVSIRIKNLGDGRIICMINGKWQLGDDFHVVAAFNQIA